MALTANQRKGIVDDLTTNCDCWKGEGDREVLNRFSDDKLMQLQAHAEREAQAIQVANSAANGFTDKNGTAYRVNPETGKWEMKVTANAPIPPQFRKKAPPVAPVEDEEEDVAEGVDETLPEEDEEDNGPMMRRNKKAYNSRKPQTMEQFIRSAPPEVQNMIRAAQNVEQKEKDKIISQMLVNVADADKRAHYDRLQRRSLDELVNDLSMIPKAPPADQVAAMASPSMKKNATRNRGGEDMLVPPTINWEEVDGEQKSAAERVGGGRQVVDNDDSDDRTDDDYINNLPAHLRSAVQNAVVIEAREKRKIIDELTANVSDDESEKRLRHRLSQKSLEELKDLASLTPRREQRQTNYFGAAAPLGNARQVTNDTQEDILVPPTVDWKANARDVG